MLEGVHLTLMIGPAVPVPVSRDVVEALESVTVQTASREGSGFELRFRIPKDSPLLTLFLVSGGVSIPLVRVVIIATVNGVPEVLMDGVMDQHQLIPAAPPERSTLVIKGRDLSAAMDYLCLNGIPYPAMPASVRVLAILAKYAVLGVVPVVIPSIMPDVPNPVKHIPRQKGTDLEYVKRLAEENGYVFYVSPGPAPLTSVAYWGPLVKVGVPQPALNVDMDAHTNVESLSFQYDSQNATMPVVFIQEENTKVPIPIPIPDISPLSPPLGLVPPIPQKINQLNDTAKLSPIRAVLRGLAERAKSAEVVSVSGKLDVARYGRLLKARGLVGLRGAGLAFDGLYYVDSVTHEIKRGEYKQGFKLTRNGLISTVPQVAA